MKKLASVEHVETLSLSAMRKLVGGLVDQMHELQAEVAELRAENKSLREKGICRKRFSNVTGIRKQVF